MAELILALDFSSRDEALAFISPLRGIVRWVKVGLQLFVVSGPELIICLENMGFKVFLDLKFYDIPNTVGKAVISAKSIGADMLTLHLQGGKRMCEAARESLGSIGRPYLLGVTALTSFAEGEMPGIKKTPSEFASDLAGHASAWGMDGVVCSGMEVAAIKKSYPELLCVCPGIRLKSDSGNDQRRIFSPKEAVSAGADFLVMGRSIIQSPEPEKMVGMVLDMISS